MNMLFLGAAFIIATTALYHSIQGERRVMSALLAVDIRLLSRRVRRVLRFTWHLATLLMLLTAATVSWPETPTNLVRLIGAAYLALGLAAFWVSRGRHVSGPLFSAAGLLAVAGTL
ncbi:MAG: hypothetical protein ACXW2T_07660 [Allosphingosinicella sp.]